MSFWKNILFGSKAYGVAYGLLDGGEVIHYIELAKSKREVVIRKNQVFTSLADCLTVLAKKSGIVIVLNSNQVLTKYISEISKDLEGYISRAFPTIKQEDFFASVWKTGNGAIVSVCRKEYLLEIINEYQNQSVYVFNIYLGYTALADISSFLDNGIYQSGNYQFSINEGVVNEVSIITSDSENYSGNYALNGINIGSRYLNVFAGTLSNFIASSTNIYLSDDLGILITEKRDAYKQERIFALSTRAGIISLLVVLLINFFFFNHYFTRVNDMEQNAQINKSTKEQLQNLNATVNATQKAVDNLLQHSSSKSSWYLNEIMMTLPETVLLSEFNYQPIEKRIKKEAPILIAEHIIYISGNTSDSKIFSLWVELLERFSWIKSVEVHQYADVSEKLSDFRLKIVLDAVK